MIHRNSQSVKMSKMLLFILLPMLGYAYDNVMKENNATITYDSVMQKNATVPCPRIETVKTLSSSLLRRGEAPNQEVIHHHCQVEQDRVE